MLRCRLCLLIIASVGLAVACASGDKSGGKTAAALDAALSPEENLRQLAEAEAQAAARQPRPLVVPVAPPPGVEPQTLARRPADDLRAPMTLAEALADVQARNPPALAAAPEPAEEVDSEKQAAAAKLYAKGRNAALNNRHLQAVTDLQKALELDPNSPEILRELAAGYVAVGNSSKAVELFQQLIGLQPENSEALFTLGLAAANRRDFEQAAAMLGRLRGVGKSFTHDPAADTLADFTLALALRETGYDRASIEASTAALNLPERLTGPTEHMARLGSVYRQRGETWRAIGDAHCRLGEYDEALAAYANSAALPTADPSALHPRIVYAHLARGRVQSAQHELLTRIKSGTDAIGERDILLCAYLSEHAKPNALLAAALSELYRARPDDSSRARAAASLLAADQAQALLKEFVDRRPRDFDAVSQLLGWLAQRDTARAVQMTVALVEAYPDLADAYINRLAVVVPNVAATLAALRGLPETPARTGMEARLLARVGALGEAWSVCAAGRQRWPDDRGLVLRQIQLASELQEPALLDEAMAGAPEFENAAGFIVLSQARRAVGQTEQAVELARQALAVEPESIDAVIEIARAEGSHAALAADDPARKAEVEKSLDEAVKHAEQAISAAPAREEAYEVLALVYGPGGIQADTQLFRQVAQRLREANPDSPLYARLAAQEAIAQRRYEQALERLVNLCDNNPSDKASLALLISTWERAGKIESAEKWLSEKMQSRPGDANLLEQWVRVQLLRNRAETAIKRLQAAIEADGGDFVARRLLESVYRTTGQMDSALELGEQRLLARPEGVRREVELAALYAGAELADKALERLEWIRDHASGASLAELAGALGIAGRLQGNQARRDALALALSQHTLAQHPAAPLEVYAAGLEMLARQGRDDQFEALAQQAAEQSKDSRTATIEGAGPWRNLAQTLVSAGQPGAAARALRARLGHGAKLEAQAFGALARIAMVADAAASVQARGSGNHAADSIALLHELNERGWLNIAIDLNEKPTLSGALYEVSVYYGFLGADAGCETILREAIRINPDNSMALNNLGYMRLEQGHSDRETTEIVERAHAHDPNEPNILDTIGWLRYKQGRIADEPGDGDGAPTPGALSLIQRAIEQNPESSPEVFDHLGDAQWRAGDTEAAIKAWWKVVHMLEDPNFEQRVTQQFALIQSRVWQLAVADPREMYARDYQSLLEGTREKLKAAAGGGAPAVEPTWAEGVNR